MRIIVGNPVDALFVLRALREEHTIMYPNVKPTRSRNTLVDLNAYDDHVRACLGRYQRAELDEIATVKAIHAFDHKPESTEQVDWNPYSSEKYQSIQFTCRQMIRFANPLFARMRAAQAIAQKHLTGEPLEEMLGALTTQGVDPEIQFFFPYEVQLMDIASFQAATEGRASYGEYKARQVVSVRRRVLPRVLQLLGVPDEVRPDREHSAAAGGAAKPIPLRRAFASTGILPNATLEELRALLNSEK